MMTKEGIKNNKAQSISDIDKQPELSHAASFLTPKEATHPFSPLGIHFRAPLKPVLTGGSIQILVRDNTLHYKQDPEQRLWEANPFEPPVADGVSRYRRGSQPIQQIRTEHNFGLFGKKDGQSAGEAYRQWQREQDEIYQRNQEPQGDTGGTNESSTSDFAPAGGNAPDQFTRTQQTIAGLIAEGAPPDVARQKALGRLSAKEKKQFEETEQRGNEEKRPHARKLSKPGENYALDQDFASGMPYPRMGEKYDVDERTVRREAKRRGIERPLGVPRKLPAVGENTELEQDLSDPNMKRSDTAEKYDVSVSTVRRAIEARGIERPRGAQRKLPKPGENYALDQDFASGMPYPRMGEKWDVGLRTVNRGAAMRKAQHASQETGEIHTTSDLQEATEEHPFGFFLEDGKEIDLDPNGNVPLREHNEW